MKLSFVWLVISLQTSFCFAQREKSEELLLEDYGEAAAYYYGLCLGVEELKKSSCPNMAIPAQTQSSQCLSEILSLVPESTSSELRAVLLSSTGDLETVAKSSVTTGYGKVLELANQDAEKACIAFGTGLLVASQGASENIKFIAGKHNFLASP